MLISRRVYLELKLITYFPQPLQAGKQPMLCHAFRRRDSHDRRSHAYLLLHFFLESFERAYHVGGRTTESLPLLSKRYPGRGAKQERRTNVTFELSEATAERGLTHAQLVCRTVHAPQSRDNEKEPKEIPVRTLR